MIISLAGSVSAACVQWVSLTVRREGTRSSGSHGWRGGVCLKMSAEQCAHIFTSLPPAASFFPLMIRTAEQHSTKEESCTESLYMQEE